MAGIDPGWAPLYQTLVWVVFLSALVVAFRTKAGAVVDHLVRRIEAGAPVTMGSVSIGSPPAAVQSGASRSATAEGAAGVPAPPDVEDLLLEKRYPPGLSEDVYLVHASQVLRERTAGRAGSYRVRVWLEANSPAQLLECTRVVYRLHDTWQPKVVATEARDQEFELWLTAYGEFTLVAYVERQGNLPPLWVTRYLDLPGRPPE